MKKISFVLFLGCLLSFSVVAQVKLIEKNLYKAERLLQDGFPKQAETLLDTTLNNLDFQENIPLFVKANILYISSIAEYQEDAIQKSIQHLEKTLHKSQSPATEIFHSYLGELYNNFFVNNSRKTDVEESNDLTTWSTERIKKKSQQHFLLSLKNSSVLQSQSIEDYKVILTNDKDQPDLMPTLYDVLVMRFFNTSEQRFSIEQYPELLSPLNEFLKHDWTVDSAKFESFVVAEFQKTLNFHLNRVNPITTTPYPKDALIFFETFRLNFFDRANQKPQLKINALDYLINTFSNEPAVSSAYFEKAKLLNELPYNAETGENRWSKVEAEKICKEAIERYSNTYGAKNCSELMKELYKKSFSIQVENDIPINRSSLMLLDFKNIESLYFTVFQISNEKHKRELLLTYGNKEALYKKLIDNASPKLSWTVRLPEQKDFRPHTTEIELPALSSGFYLIFCSTSQKLDETSPYSVAPVQVSDLFPIFLKENEQKNLLLVVDRLTGKPLKEVTVTCSYDKGNQFATLETTKTDENGCVEIIKNTNYNMFFITLKLNDDTYYINQIYLNNYFDNFYKNDQTVVSLFTDCSIYRPGQTVYYKGIVYRRNMEEIKVIPDYNTQLIVKDANYQEFFKQDLTSNDFGSFNGSFVIPNNVLNGNILLKVESTFKTIRVEEYKPPRFEVTLESPTNEVVLKDTVVMQGKALMINGLPLQNATVKFFVNRSYYAPWRYFFFDVQQTEIFSGSVKTDENGVFVISFVALPENDDLKNYFYRFNVVAEVTDITGEVQQTETTIVIGKEPINIQLSVDDFVILGENDQVNFDIKNTESKSLPIEATLVVEKMKSPQQIYTERKWNFPEIQMFTKQEFEKKFPNYLYEPLKEEVEKEVFRKDYSLEDQRTLNLSSLQLSTGHYRITVLTTNKWGEKVEKKAIVQILNTQDSKNTLKTNALFKISHSFVKIGDTVSLYYVSDIKNAKMFYTLTTANQKKEKQWINIENKKNGIIHIPTGDHLNTDFLIKVYICQNNRYYTVSQYVTVVDPKTKLTMEVSGIRDKTLPGSQEKWRIKIKDSEGNPVLASMFAEMYDASLDKLEPHVWEFQPKKIFLPPSLSEIYVGLSSNYFSVFNRYDECVNYYSFTPISLNWFHFSFWRHYRGVSYGKNVLYLCNKEVIDGVHVESMAEEAITEERDIVVNLEQEKSETTPNIRENFNETAFFYPDIRTDNQGEIVLEFTMPETSTRWNMMGIAYTKSLQTVAYDTSIITKSDFMVLPNLPRFLRSGDECYLTTRIANSSDQPISGIATLQLENPMNETSLNRLIVGDVQKTFEVDAGKSIVISWKVKVTNEVDLLQIIMSATSGMMTDGEKHIIPILPNETMALETVAIELSEAGHHSFTLNNITNPDAQPKKLTIECTTNPIWYAIQSLPTLMECKYECTDYIFNSLYSIILSGYILNSNPEIKQTFDNWMKNDHDAFLSNLEKNQELKNILLNETPWLLEAKNETAQKQRLTTLFDVNQLNYNKKNAFEKLKIRQTKSGAFVWFPEMGESWFITQYIVNGIGKLKTMNISNAELDYMAAKAVQYLDRKIQEIKSKYPESVKFYLDYLFARSYFINVPMDPSVTDIMNEIKNHSIKNHTKLDFNNRAKLALALQRIGEEQEAKNIATSLDNYGLGNKKTGIYWRTQQGSGFASDISLSALMAEVYKNILKDETSLMEVQKFLIRNKRTNEWINATATADAVYALMLGEKPLQQNNPVTFTIGKQTIYSENEKTQDGSGYFKRSFTKFDDPQEMKNITVETENNHLIFGAVYLQYQIPIDKIIKTENQDLTVDKKLFVAKIENGKTVYTQIDKNSLLNVGDKVIVRLNITSARDMEYVHLNDMRSGSFEPIETKSHYVWKSDLGYYFDIKDASVNLFFEKVPRGSFVIEYELWATQQGAFSNGFSTIQCMYAPEFSGNSDGTQVKIK